MLVLAVTLAARGSAAPTPVPNATAPARTLSPGTSGGRPTPVALPSAPPAGAAPATPGPAVVPTLAPSPTAAPLVPLLPPGTSASPTPGPTIVPTPTARAKTTFLNGYDGPPGDRLPLELDGYGVVAYALRHAPALIAQEATVENLDITYTRNRAAEFPTLVAQAQNQLSENHGLSGNLAQFGLSPASRFSQNTAQLSASYNIYNAGQQLVAQEAKRNVESAKFELRRLEEQLAIGASADFYNLAALHEVVVLDRADVVYQKQLLQDSEANERVGRIAGVDVLRSRVAVDRSSSALVQATTDEANAADALAVRIGAPIATRFSEPAELPAPALPAEPLELLVRIAKLNRPEVLEAKATLQASRLLDASFDNDLRPVVQVTGAFGSQVSPTSFVQEQQQIDAQNAANLASYNAQLALFPGVAIAPPAVIAPVNRRQPGFWQIGVSSTFQVPLYDYGVRAADHHYGRAQIESSLASLYNAYDFVTSDVDSAQRSLTAADQRLVLAKASAAYATEAARIAQLQYKNGLISFTDATQTQQTALAAQNDLVAARVTYVTGVIRLRVSLAPPDTAAAVDFRGL